MIWERTWNDRALSDKKRNDNTTIDKRKKPRDKYTFLKDKSNISLI